MRRAAPLLLLMAAGGLAAAFLAGRSAKVPAPPIAGGPGEGLSILLITVDTLRADALGSYGQPDAGTPWMDRLAAGGLRFDDAHAHNVVTLPSHVNILSGRYPFEHGVRDNAGFRMPPATETLATILKARGHATAAFVSAFPLDARFGLTRGFDVYDARFVDAVARPAFLEQERRGSETVALARQWLDTQAGRPAFCWVHVYEPHAPYDPPEPFRSRFAGRPYQGEVAATDALLAPLLEPVLAAGESGRTLVVLTSDHGEALGEHGEATHGIFAYESTLRVPLLLHLPARIGSGVVSTPARHVDLLPTILEALGVPVPGGLPGRSLLRAAVSPPAPSVAGDETPTYFEALSGQLNRGWAPLRGVIRGRRKYVELPIPEVYDLAADPREATNLASRSGTLEPLRAALAAFTARDGGPAPAPESAETRERLQGLGYLAGGPAPSGRRYTEEDDPKRLIALDAKLQEVVRLYTSGDLRAALARARELVRLRPDMPVSLLHLAHLEREAGNLAAAVGALGKVVGLDPEDTTARALLGAYLTEAGRAAEAVKVLEAAGAAGEADPDLATAKGLALARAGRTTEALSVLARAAEANPANAMTLVHIGTVHLIAEDRARAREAFAQALRVNPGVARAHSSLGFLLAEEGRVEESLGHWRKAVELDARESGKLLALVSLLAQRGRSAETRPYLELFVASAPPAAYAREIERARSWLGGSARVGR